MPVPLDEWQVKMELHFSALAEQRAASGYPIFALEHGLSEGELQEITLQLHVRILAGSRLAPHWLLWTIYASERGYTYGGGEYWQSFEEGTPGWDSGDRYRVSTWFRKFQKTYDGVVPSGPWAAHFSIIAWPITHAVLPRYLQQQFARTLYDLRFTLARLNSIEPAVIGRLIASNVYYASTRFEQFLQQEELVGRLVLALLHQDPREGEEPLFPATLERIVTDLEKVRRRGWLSETGRIVTDRFKGIGRGSNRRNISGASESASKLQRELRPDIRPDLRLRYVGDGNWTLVIDVPSFKAVAALNPDVQQFLRQTRCKLNGDPGKKPASWVLSGNRRAVLKDWPDPTQPLVGFEKANGLVDHLLESECRMSTGPIWLFRIGRDGTAREIAGRIVRPGYGYILISRDPFETTLGGMKSCTVECSNVEAIHICVPDYISTEYFLWLRQRNLELARTIRVWPAGLPGRNWDGEGRSEWLTTEKPYFGVVPDHPVDSYLVTLGNGVGTVIQARAVGQPTFLELPQLEPGTHILRVRAHRSTTPGELGATPAHEGFLELRVRDPEPWLPGTASHAGLVVLNHPHDASLNVLWENEMDLTVFGPEGHQVTPSVSLENAEGEEIYNAKVSAPMDLPITADAWRKRFLDFLRRENCEWRYLEAISGLLTIDGQELGQFVLRFDHEAPPVRWVLRHSGAGVSVRLIDDSGQEDLQPRCHFFSMETPTRSERLELHDVLAGFNVIPPGGLYVAQNGEFRDSVIVSVGLTAGGLEGLGVRPVYGGIPENAKAIISLLRILRHWDTARVAGFLTSARRAQVVDGLLARIFVSIAGSDWSRAESGLRDATNLSRALDRLQALLKHRGGFSIVLRRDAVDILGDRVAISKWYAELAERFDVCSDTALCLFAIDLASQPDQVSSLYGKGLPDLLERLSGKPLLFRGARFIVLNSVGMAAEPSELLPSWR